MKGERRKPERGIVVLEMALISSLVMFLLGGVFDLANYFQTRSRIQYAVSQSARFALTGTQVDDPNAPGTLLSREDSIVNILERVSGITFADGAIDIQTVGSDGTLTAGAGGPGDIVLVSVTYELRVATPGLNQLFESGTAPIHCSTRYRNEEFVAALAPNCVVELCGAMA